MPEESKHWQIGAAIEDALREIEEGDTYHYTPDAVVGVTFPTDALLNSGMKTIYAVACAGEESHGEVGSKGPDGVSVRAHMEAFILVLQAYGGSEDPFNQGDPTRHLVVDRMVRDVIGKLLEDVQLGGLVENLFAEPARVDREKALAAWACAEIRLSIAYTYDGRP